MISSAVLGVVLFTMVVFGSLMPLIKLLFSDVLQSRDSMALEPHSPLNLASPMIPNRPEKRSFMHRTWRRFDNSVIKKYLITKEARLERARRENKSIDLSTL